MLHIFFEIINIQLISLLETNSDSEAEFNFPPYQKDVSFFSKNFFLKKDKPKASSLRMESILNPSILFKSKKSLKSVANRNKSFDEQGDAKDTVIPFLKNECIWFHPMNKNDPGRNLTVDNRLTSRLIRCLTLKYNLKVKNLATKRLRRFITEELYRLLPDLRISKLKFMDKLSRSIRNKRLESRQ